MISLETKTELHISNLDLETDPGKYACNGTNSEGTSQAVIVLRVRNRFAALWPFLGIVAEVLVLVTVIFIYEKRRKPDEVLDGEPTRPSLTVRLGGAGSPAGGLPTQGLVCPTVLPHLAAGGCPPWSVTTFRCSTHAGGGCLGPKGCGSKQALDFVQRLFRKPELALLPGACGQGSQMPRGP